MAATIWDTSVRASIADRAQRVTAEAKPGWGKMNAGGMMAPGLIARCPGAVLEDEKKIFAELMQRCAAVTPATTFAEHPAFGDLSDDEYGALIANHTDHHLRQFGA